MVLFTEAEVKRRMDYSFKDMKHWVEDFFWEIERRSWSPRRAKGSNKRQTKKNESHKLKNLHSDIQYEGGKG